MKNKMKTTKKIKVSKNRVEKLKDEVACIATITDMIALLANAMGVPYSHLAAEVVLAIINSIKKEEIGKEV